MKISLIVAISENGVIGKNNQLPWHLPADLKYFKSLTTGHCVIMGRKTYESIGKPLPNRFNIIITRSRDFTPPGCLVVNSIEEAIKAGKNCKTEVFIIGGADIFKQSLKLANRIYLTKIHKTFEGDTFFPYPDPKEWHQVSEEKKSYDEKNPYDYSFLVFERIHSAL